jgi:hypothetical protein
MVWPLPAMVTAVVTASADGPTLPSPTVVRLIVCRARAAAKSMVSASGVAFAWTIASRRLPAPASAGVVTVNVAGVVRSSRLSSASRRGR